ncbi:SDR family oxidoreductase [candidate division KSB1 bacterium]|nr:SDR family oxidoreductase [candidate division KSB1 bacterium]
MAHYLVTGGAGFIGSNIVEELLRRKHKVRILDNFSTGKRETVEFLINKASKLQNSNGKKTNGNSNLEVFEGDLRSYHIVREAVEGVDYILHQGALPSVPRSVRDPITSNEVNVVGTLNILNAAKEAKIRSIVYASSSSCYGDLAQLPKTEDMLPNPLSPYAVSKLAAEKYCQVFYKLYNLETVSVRYFNVFGPRQDPTSQYSAVIPKFISIMMTSKAPVIYGDGEQSRDFTYVQNVVEANLQACEVGHEELAGEVFNIAYGKRITLNDLVEKINGILGTTIKPVYSEPRAGDVKHSLANIGKARQFLGYDPKFDFDQGLKMTIDTMRKHEVEEYAKAS